VVAIDPGEKHCGIAWFNNGEFTAITMSPDKFLNQLHKLMLAGDNLMTLVVEEFRLFPWKSGVQAFSQMSTCEVIGVIKYLARLYNQEVVFQKPSDVKSFVSDNKLRQAGMLTGDSHAKDASRHLFYYLKFRR
jgi:hypothetical protein